ncbi:type II toxin-antitoxin system VapC family toxin [Arhodomonas sp. SL1]|uniref:type II toxin-antitoxin system VapC family toxin n=1 Tax=Arhodomonas sp. SL1 TaxID=3425691 RepID=UPI003F8825D3
MIVLDTNVLSEVLRPVPEHQVVDWLERQPRRSLFTTTVTRGELFYGVRLLPEGQRRHRLMEALEAILDEDFAGQVLSFDADAADSYADIAAARRMRGRPISQFDAMIAATARSRGAALATRNIRDFADCGLELIDPWSA